jgi:hypothetical protein
MIIGAKMPYITVNAYHLDITKATDIGPRLVPFLNSKEAMLCLYGYIGYSELLNPKARHRTEFCGIYGQPVAKTFGTCGNHPIAN